MSNGLRMTLHNDKELVQALLALSTGVFNRVLKAAITKTAKPVVAEARAQAPTDTGALKRSIGVVVKKYPRKQVVTAVIGARGGEYSAGTGRDSAGKFTTGGKRVVPALYSHLVEKGHRIVKAHSLQEYVNRYGTKSKRRGSGTTTGTVPPHPFLRPALLTREATVLADLKAALAIGIEREAARVARRGKAAA